MKSYYQIRTGCGGFLLPANVFVRMIKIIADYPEYLRSKNDSHRIYKEAIDEALQNIPYDYVPYIMEHIVNDKPFPLMGFTNAAWRDVQAYEQQLIFFVARNLGDI